MKHFERRLDTPVSTYKYILIKLIEMVISQSLKDLVSECLSLFYTYSLYLFGSDIKMS